MPNTLTWILTNDGGLSIIANGKHRTVARTHENFAQIKDAVKAKDPVLVLSLIDVQKKVQEYINQATTQKDEDFKVEVLNGMICVNGRPVDNEISRRARVLMDNGLPFDGMVNFLRNLLQNPSYNSQKQLFQFLMHHNLPITDDGYFLAYKGVRENWTDNYSGTYDNRPGRINKMARCAVDDNFHNACSHGFHAGTIEHARSFGGNGHMILVKINPRDVVSVPSSDSTKLRCCEYEVLSGYDTDVLEPLPAPSYTAPSNTDPVPTAPFSPPVGLSNFPEPPTGTAEAVSSLADFMHTD